MATQPTFLDVRAEQEYAKGHFPNSINAPILNNDERREVGTTYKTGRRRGSALRPNWYPAQCENNVSLLGKAFVPNRQRSHHVLARRPTIWLAQQWLADQGIKRPRIEGGFKRCDSKASKFSVIQKKFWLLSGRTGSAKTVIIKQLPNSIDLEGHANHRGSAFGCA